MLNHGYRMHLLDLKYGESLGEPQENKMVEASEEIYSSLHQQFKGDLLRPSR